MTRHPTGPERDRTATPSSLAVRLIARRLPPADAEFALGDLEEDFHDVAAARGLMAARRWYWAQTARVLLGRPPAPGAPAPESTPRRPMREHMTDTLRDITLALRAFRRHPVLTLAGVLTLALGIGANAAVFSVAWPVLASPLPLPDEDRLAVVMLSVPQEDGPPRENSLSPGDFLDIGKSTSFQAMAGYTRTAAEWNLTEAGDPMQVRIAGVTRGFFDVMGVTPLAGRPLNADDEARGVLAVVINERLWRARFGADPAIVGRTIRLNGAGWTVIGVMPDAATLGTVDADVWRAQPIDEATAYQMQSYFLAMVGRIRDGISLEDANVELQGLMRRVHEERRPTNELELSAKADSLRERLTGPVRPSLLLLVGGAALVLLIAGINLTGLQLSRNLSRRQELVVRRALGAGRMRIIAQLTTEGLVLAAIGGLVGLGAAAATLRGLSRLAPPVAWYEVAADLSPSIVLFTGALALTTGLVIGLWSAWTVVNSTETTPTGARGGTAGRTASRARWGILAGQVAMTVVLLVSATLTSASLLKVLDVDRGFTLERALIADVQVAQGTVASPIQFFHDLVDRTAALPGATGSCAISEMPLDTPGGWWTFVPEDRPADLRIPQAAAIGITDDCFDVLGIPILNGRSFTASESEGVAIVSASAARALWPDHVNVLDRIVHLGTASGMALRVVGVVPDIHVGSLETMERGQVWLSSSRGFPLPERLIVATEVPPATLTSQVRAVLNGLAPGLALANVRTMDEVVASATAARRFVFVLLVSFAAIALLLCGVGIYGVLSHQVGQRTREIGIRMALGAGTLDVTRTLSRHVLTGVTLGLAAGLTASWVLSSALAALMFEMSATDARVYSGVAVFVGLIACIAALPPLGRAVRVQPLNALRLD